MNVKDGTFVSVIGPNGSGKSTLLKCLMNILKPNTGAVFIDQNDISKLPELDLAKLRSAVLSDRVYPFNMTVHEIISLGRYPHQKFLNGKDRTDQEIIFQSASLLGVEEFLDKKFSELSDGQKQKVLIARALCQKPRVLILDEPATHLDTRSRIEILLKLREISRQENIIVIASMHEIEITVRISDQIIILEDGRILTKGSPEEILQNDIINKIYKNDRIVWSKIFGSIEIKCKPDLSKIHVVSCNGTGIPIFRLLLRLGYSFSAGILDQHDIDFYFAKEIHAQIFCNKEPYEPLEKVILDTLSGLDKTQIVVDTGFAINSHNKANVDLMKTLHQKNQVTLLSLRDKDEGKRIFGNSINVRYLAISDLENVLDELIKISSLTTEIVQLA